MIMNKRRHWMILALGVGCILVVSALVMAQTSASSANMDQLYGSWHVEVTLPAQGATFPALITFGAGGSVITDEPPSPGETSGHGNWTSAEDGTVSYTFVALFSGEEGAYAGGLKVVGTLQYDANTEGWQGPFKIDGFDADGQTTFSDTGTFVLTRIAVESLD
jgi:hypothetical protein